MGFMDKAKKMAEQAQQKLDERQRRPGERGEETEAGAGTVRFDDQGRPVPDETAEAQAAAGIPTGESMQAEPGTVPPGLGHGEPGRAHEPIEGEQPEGTDFGKGQPPAGRVERSGAAGNADENRGASPVESDDIHTNPETKK